MAMDQALIEAAKNGNGCESIFKYVDPKAQLTIRKDTILHVAVKYGNSKSTKQILELYPFLVHETNINDDTPLHIAARLGHFDSVKLITTVLKKDQARGAEEGTLQLRAENMKKETALHEAVKHGHFDVVDLLIREDPGLVYVCNGLKESPLFIAVDKRFYRIADTILSSISDWSRSCISGRNEMTVMHAVAFRVFDQHLFISVIDSWLKQDWKFVYIVLKFTLLIFLKLGGFMCKKSHDQRIKKWQDFVEKLVEKCGPKILEEKDQRGMTALHYAAYVGNAKVVELFLKKNRSLAYIKDNKGMSAMHICAMEGHIDVINELVKQCPDVCELLDHNNQTPLHLAVKSKRAYTVWNFLNRTEFDGIMTNEQDNEGNTPLHVASLSGDHEILAMLAAHPRVERNAINHKGMTAVDIIPSTSQLISFDKISVLPSFGLLGANQRLEKISDNKTSDISSKAKDNLPGSTKHHDDEKKCKKEDITKHHDDEKKHKKEDITKHHNDEKKHKKEDSASKSWDEHLVEVNLVVATIIASITFAAAVSMPGGYDNPIGAPSLRKKRCFRYFLVFDCVAFGFAASSMVIHFLFVSLSGSKLHYPFQMVMWLTYLSIAFSVCAFATAIQAVLAQTERPTTESLPAVYALLSFFIPLIIYLLSVFFRFFRLLSVFFRCFRFFQFVVCKIIGIKASLTKLVNYMS